jgi:hypothetical protein
MIGWFSTSLDTAGGAKSRFIFTVAKELNDTGGFGICAATPPVTD